MVCVCVFGEVVVVCVVCVCVLGLGILLNCCVYRNGFTSVSNVLEL